MAGSWTAHLRDPPRQRSRCRCRVASGDLLRRLGRPFRAVHRLASRASIEIVRDAVTAGVILEFEGLYVFQTGLNRSGDALGVVRLGGHVEPGETAEECARREVREEGNAEASLVAAGSTWSYEPDGESFHLTPYEGETSHPAPLLVTSMAPDRGSGSGLGVSLTYLAVARNLPTPGAETQALIFLTTDEIHRLTSEATPLGALLEAGGSIDEATPLPRQLPLRPHGQLKALAELLWAGELPPLSRKAVDGSRASSGHPSGRVPDFRDRRGEAGAGDGA